MNRGDSKEIERGEWGSAGGERSGEKRGEKRGEGRGEGRGRGERRRAGEGEEERGRGN